MSNPHAPSALVAFLQGLARFCTEKYSAPSAANISNNYAHLTNYAVNKHNPAFVFNK